MREEINGFQKKVFMWVFVVKNKIKRDWVQESAQANEVDDED